MQFPWGSRKTFWSNSLSNGCVCKNFIFHLLYNRRPQSSPKETGNLKWISSSPTTQQLTGALHSNFGPFTQWMRVFSEVVRLAVETVKLHLQILSPTRHLIHRNERNSHVKKCFHLEQKNLHHFSQI